MSHNALILLIALLGITMAWADTDGTLILVQVVHRHGDRAPVFIDPAFQGMWQDIAEAGQLTTIGMSQHKAFGAMLRQQYIENPEPFLANFFVNQNLEVRSTDFDRTLMSVQSLLSTLYPDTFVPIHTVPNSEDLLLQPIDTCPSYTSKGTVVQDQNDAFLESQQQALIQSMVQITGLTPVLNTQGASAALITAYDNWVCMTAHNLTIPPAYTTIFPQLQAGIRSLWFNQYVDAAGGVTNDPRGPMGAYLLQTIVQNMQAAVTTTQTLSAGGAMAKPVSQQQRQHQQTQDTSTSSDTESAPNAAQVFKTVKGESIRGSTKQQQRQKQSARAQAMQAFKTVKGESLEHSHSPSFEQQPQQPRVQAAGGSSAIGGSDGIKFFIYSAHDTTLLALFTALELLHEPTDAMITPPYASSVVFELWKSASGAYTVNARYGMPQREPDNGPADDQTGWSYTQSVINLNCPSGMPSCAFPEWADHVYDLTANVANPEAGCCYITPAFNQLGCNNYTANALQLATDCLKYRAVCPQSTCGELNGSVLDEVSLQCVIPTNAAATVNDPQTEKYKSYAIGLGVTSALLFVLWIGSVLYLRNKLYLTSYGNLQERLTHSQFV